MIDPPRASSYRALGFRFSLRVEGAGGSALGEALAWAFQGLATPNAEPPPHRYVITPDEAGGFLVRRDDEALGQPSTEASVASVLMADLNGQAVASVPERLVLHAGAVSMAGRGLLLAAPSGSGKTTLTAALVKAGCGYLTDEAAAIDIHSRSVEPYAKPLSLSSNSLAALDCPPSELVRMDAIAATSLRAEPWSGPVPANLIVFPRFEAGAPTELTALSRGEALVEVANNSFNFVDHGSAWLPALRDIVAGCSCWWLTFGDAPEAAALIMERLS